MREKYFLKIGYFLTSSIAFTLFGCKEGGQGLQEAIQKALKPNIIGASSSSSSRGKLIGPSQEDILSQANSIRSCPDEAIPIGKAFPKGKTQWCAYKDKSGTEIKHGEFRVWHPSGELKALAFYRDGELEGEYKEWYQDKKPKELAKYSKGRRHGKTIFYSPDGFPSEEVNFSNDEKNGLYIKNTRFHKAFEKGIFKAGLKDGLWEFFDTNGNLKERVEFSAGQKHGKVERYNKEGLTIASGFYDRDQEIGHWIYFSNKGIKLSEGNLILGKKSGRWVDYTPTGEQFRISFFDNGRRMDSYKVAVNTNGGPGSKFGGGDILGAEPPIRNQQRNQPIVNRSFRADKPSPLAKGAWSPL